MKRHFLKIDEKWSEAVVKHQKKAEVRMNDRDFQTGDEIVFEHTTPDSFAPEGFFKITHVLHNVPGLDPDYVVLSIEPNEK